MAENVGAMRFFCQTCPYVQNIQQKVTMPLSSSTVQSSQGTRPQMTMPVKNLPRKERDEVVDVDQFKKGAQTIRVQGGCPKCSHEVAAFRSLQIRSADEPMTTFYCCVECSHQWKDGG